MALTDNITADDITALLGDGWTTSTISHPRPDGGTNTEWHWHTADGTGEVAFYNGCIVRASNRAGDHTRILNGTPAYSAQQVADLLHAVGLVPVELTSAFAAGWKAGALAVAEKCVARRDLYLAREAYEGANGCDGDAVQARRIANKVITATRTESPA